MTRADCERWLWDHYQVVVPKSACVACPFHADRYWVGLQRHSPEEFEAACRFARDHPSLPGVKGECFLHSSCIPLREIDFSRTRRNGARSRGARHSCLTAARVYVRCERRTSHRSDVRWHLTGPRGIRGYRRGEHPPLHSPPWDRWQLGQHAAPAPPAHYRAPLARDEYPAGSGTGRPRLLAQSSYLLDYTYVTCPTGQRSLRYRSGFARTVLSRNRRLPVYLDSAAYREAAWARLHPGAVTPLLRCIDLIRPDGAMARDVLGNQDASREGYDRLCRDGYAMSLFRSGRPARLGPEPRRR